MMKNDSTIINLLRYAAVIGNALFVLWIIYNGIDEGFQGTNVQMMSYLGLIFLLILNSFLLLSSKNKK